MKRILKVPRMSSGYFDQDFPAALKCSRCRVAASSWLRPDRDGLCHGEQLAGDRFSGGGRHRDVRGTDGRIG
jgi:hypothetical protein